MADVRDFLARARALVPAREDTNEKLFDHDDYLGHNELEIAMDVLADIEEGSTFRAPPAFWEALEGAAALMGLTDRVATLRRQRHGAEHGYFRVRVRVAPDTGPVLRGHRTSWDIGNVRADAVVSIEFASRLEGGQQGNVQLHPDSPEVWNAVVSGRTITMLDGDRVVGEGVVIDVVPPAP